jgi:hypothetical protein
LEINAAVLAIERLRRVVDAVSQGAGRLARLLQGTGRAHAPQRATDLISPFQ